MAGIDAHDAQLEVLGAIFNPQWRLNLGHTS
jgi:hypothetical protein